MSDIILHVEASANFFILLVLLFPYIICLPLYSYVSVLFALNYSSLLQSHPCLTLMMQTVFQTL